MLKKTNLLIIAFLGLAMLTNAQKKFFPYEYDTRIMDNGLTVVLIPMESPGLVSYQSVVRTGSRDEWEPGKSGFAHFFEHMMFRGTEKYPGPVYDSLMTTIGADANAYTTDDRTVYHQNFASEDLKLVIELEADRFQNLSYPEEDFQTEAGAVYGEYRKSVTSPWQVAFEALQDMAFDKHTYKHTTIGFERDIIKMPEQYEYSKSFFKRYYRPENVIIIIAGDIEKEQTFKWINEYYGNWEKGYVEPKITPEPPQTEMREKTISFEGRTLPLMIISHKGDAFDLDNKNIFAAMLLDEIAFGSTSDIYKKLVLNEQKVQFVSGDFGFTRDPGLLYIYSMVKSENDLDYVKNEIISTLDKYKEELVPEDKLNDLKKRTKYSYIMNLDNPKSVAGSLPQFVTYTGSVDVIDKMYNVIDSITPEDIKEAANRYFKEQKRNIITIKGAN